MSLLDDAREVCATVANDSAGEPITYRSAASVVLIEGIRGRSVYSADVMEMSARVDSAAIDWLIRPEALVINGSKVEPKRGDRIETEAGETFEVMPGPDDQEWRPSDQFTTFFRIHTVKRVQSQ